MALSFAEIQELFKARPAELQGMSLPQYSKYQNAVTGTQLYAAADNPFEVALKTPTYAIDQFIDKTYPGFREGLGEFGGKTFGALGLDPAVGQQVFHELGGAGTVAFLPMIVGGAVGGYGLAIGAGLTGILSGLNAYEKGSGPGQAALIGGLSAATPYFGEFGGNLALQGLAKTGWKAFPNVVEAGKRIAPLTLSQKTAHFAASNAAALTPFSVNEWLQSGMGAGEFFGDPNYWAASAVSQIPFLPHQLWSSFRPTPRTLLDAQKAAVEERQNYGRRLDTQAEQTQPSDPVVPEAREPWEISVGPRPRRVEARIEPTAPEPEMKLGDMVGKMVKVGSEEGEVVRGENGEMLLEREGQPPVLLAQHGEVTPGELGLDIQPDVAYNLNQEQAQRFQDAFRGTNLRTPIAGPNMEVRPIVVRDSGEIVFNEGPGKGSSADFVSSGYTPEGDFFLTVRDRVNGAEYELHGDDAIEVGLQLRNKNGGYHPEEFQRAISEELIRTGGREAPLAQILTRYSEKMPNTVMLLTGDKPPYRAFLDIALQEVGATWKEIQNDPYIPESTKRQLEGVFNEIINDLGAVDSQTPEARAIERPDAVGSAKPRESAERPAEVGETQRRPVDPDETWNDEILEQYAEDLPIDQNSAERDRLAAEARKEQLDFDQLMGEETHLARVADEQEPPSTPPAVTVDEGPPKEQGQQVEPVKTPEAPKPAETPAQRAEKAGWKQKIVTAIRSALGRIPKLTVEPINPKFVPETRKFKIGDEEFVITYTASTWRGLPTIMFHVDVLDAAGHKVKPLDIGETWRAYDYYIDETFSMDDWVVGVQDGILEATLDKLRTLPGYSYSAAPVEIQTPHGKLSLWNDHYSLYHALKKLKATPEEVIPDETPPSPERTMFTPEEVDAQTINTIEKARQWVRQEINVKQVPPAERFPEEQDVLRVIKANMKDPYNAELITQAREEILKIFLNDKAAAETTQAAAKARAPEATPEDIVDAQKTTVAAQKSTGQPETSQSKMGQVFEEQLAQTGSVEEAVKETTAIVAEETAHSANEEAKDITPVIPKEIENITEPQEVRRWVHLYQRVGQKLMRLSTAVGYERGMFLHRDYVSEKFLAKQIRTNHKELANYFRERGLKLNLEFAKRAKSSPMKQPLDSFRIPEIDAVAAAERRYKKLLGSPRKDYKPTDVARFVNHMFMMEKALGKLEAMLAGGEELGQAGRLSAEEVQKVSLSLGLYENELIPWAQKNIHKLRDYVDQLRFFVEWSSEFDRAMTYFMRRRTDNQKTFAVPQKNRMVRAGAEVKRLDLEDALNIFNDTRKRSKMVDPSGEPLAELTPEEAVAFNDRYSNFNKALEQYQLYEARVFKEGSGQPGKRRTFNQAVQEHPEGLPNDIKKRVSLHRNLRAQIDYLVEQALGFVADMPTDDIGYYKAMSAAIDKATGSEHPLETFLVEAHKNLKARVEASREKTPTYEVPRGPEYYKNELLWEDLIKEFVARSGVKRNRANDREFYRFRKGTLENDLAAEFAPTQQALPERVKLADFAKTYFPKAREIFDDRFTSKVPLYARRTQSTINAQTGKPIDPFAVGIFTSSNEQVGWVARGDVGKQIHETLGPDEIVPVWIRDGQIHFGHEPPKRMLGDTDVDIANAFEVLVNEGVFNDPSTDFPDRPRMLGSSLKNTLEAVAIQYGLKPLERDAVIANVERLRSIFNLDDTRWGVVINDIMNDRAVAGLSQMTQGGIRKLFLGSVPGFSGAKLKDLGNFYRFVVAHELGHNFDYMHRTGKLDPDTQTKYLQYKKTLVEAEPAERVEILKAAYETWVPKDMQKLPDIRRMIEDGSSVEETMSNLLALWATGQTAKASEAEIAMHFLPRPVFKFFRALHQYVGKALGVVKAYMGLQEKSNSQREWLKELDGNFKTFTKAMNKVEAEFQEFSKLSHVTPERILMSEVPLDTPYGGPWEGDVFDFATVLGTERRVTDSIARQAARIMERAEQVASRVLPLRPLYNSLFTMSEEIRSWNIQVLSKLVGGLTPSGHVVDPLFGSNPDLVEFRRVTRGGKNSLNKEMGEIARLMQRAQRLIADPSKPLGVDKDGERIYMDLDHLDHFRQEIAKEYVDLKMNAPVSELARIRNLELAINEATQLKQSLSKLSAEDRRILNSQINKEIQSTQRLLKFIEDSRVEALSYHIGATVAKRLLQAGLSHDMILDYAKRTTQAHYQDLVVAPRVELFDAAMANNIRREAAVSLAKVKEEMTNSRTGAAATLLSEGAAKRMTQLAKLLEASTTSPYFMSEQTFGAWEFSYTMNGERETMRVANPKEHKLAVERLTKMGAKDFGPLKPRESTSTMTVEDIDPMIISFLEELDFDMNDFIQLLPLQPDTKTYLTRNTVQELKEKFEVGAGGSFVRAQTKFAPHRVLVDPVESHRNWVGAVSQRENRLLFAAKERFYSQDPGLENYGEHVRAFKNQVRNYLAPDGPLARTLSKGLFVYTMGLNFANHFLEMLQPAASVLPQIIASGLGFKDSAKLVLDAGRKIASYNMEMLKQGLKGDDTAAWSKIARDATEAKLLSALHGEIAKRGLISLAAYSEVVEDTPGGVLALEAAARSGKFHTAGELAVRPIKIYADLSSKIYSAFTHTNARISMLAGLEVAKQKFAARISELQAKVAAERNPVTKSILEAELKIAERDARLWTKDPHNPGKQKLNDAVINEVSDFIRVTTFGGGRAGRPEIPFSTRGAHLRALSTSFYALQSYTTGMISMMARFAQHGYGGKDYKFLTQKQRLSARKALWTMMSVMWASAGMLGMPFVGAAIAELEDQTDLEVSKGIREGLAWLFNEDAQDGGLLSDLVLRGPINAAFAMTPFQPDLASRMGISGVLGMSEYDGFTAAGIYGPTGKVVEGIARGFGSLQRGQVALAAEEFVPGPWKKVISLLRNDGEIRDRAGRKMIDATNWDRLAMLMGFTPQKVREFREMTRINDRSQEIQRRKDQQFHEAMAGLYTSGRPDEARRQMDKRALEVDGYDPKAGARRVADAVIKQKFAHDPRREVSRRGSSTFETLMSTYQGQAKAPTEFARLMTNQDVLNSLGFQTNVSQNRLLEAQQMDALMGMTPMSRQHAKELLKSHPF